MIGHTRKFLRAQREGKALVKAHPPQRICAVPGSRDEPKRPSVAEQVALRNVNRWPPLHLVQHQKQLFQSFLLAASVLIAKSLSLRKCAEEGYVSFTVRKICGVPMRQLAKANFGGGCATSP